MGIGAGAALGSAVLALDTDVAYRSAILLSAAAFLLALIPPRAISSLSRPSVARPPAPDRPAEPRRDASAPGPGRQAPHPLRDVPASSSPPAWPSHARPTAPVTAAIVLSAAVVLLTFGEATSLAGGWALSYDLTPEHAQGTYQDIYQPRISVSRTLGPGLLAL
ncbi:hypothetical protein ABT117_35835 [Streptomyces sp. NPDC002262]|uniref:hypothetical protein n=1 Tax=Streptomyces sp. NPDC002262 TaxID=3154414 RepID=UPI0033281733